MPDRKRTVLIIAVDLDPIPGSMHTAESARTIIESRLKDIMPHYNPTVHRIPTHH